ncbi:hypothetical protein ACVWXN_007896 [Bradyrhizobium sp. i1.4.4]
MTGTKAPLRPLAAWAWRASCSLPVPVSPRIRIGILRAAAVSTWRTIACTAGSWATKPVAVGLGAVAGRAGIPAERRFSIVAENVLPIRSSRLRDLCLGSF